MTGRSVVARARTAGPADRRSAARQRDELGAHRARLGLDRADRHRHRPPRDGRAEGEEGAARQVADRFGLAALHAEQVGGAGHVDVEEGAAHQEIATPPPRHSWPAWRGAGWRSRRPARACGRGTSGWSSRRARRGAPPRPPRRRRRARTIAPRRPPPAPDTNDRAGHRTAPPRKAAAQRICASASSPSRLSTTEARCSRMRPRQPRDLASRHGPPPRPRHGRSDRPA